MHNASGYPGKRTCYIPEDAWIYNNPYKGSHVRMKSKDGRYTSVPVHSGEDIPKGLMRKIIREDLEMELEEFAELYRIYRGN